jgi:CheY-like chemotaxis protein
MHSMPRVILLAEDDPNYAILIQRAFQEVNGAVALQIVHDGEAVVAYLAGQGAYADRERYPLPVLMLLDLHLPRKSGFEILAWMRQQGMASPPVVALTSSEEPTELKQAYELGIRSHHAKPSSLGGLADMAKHLLVSIPDGGDGLEHITRDPLDVTSPVTSATEHRGS